MAPKHRILRGSKIAYPVFYRVVGGSMSILHHGFCVFSKKLPFHSGFCDRVAPKPCILRGSPRGNAANCEVLENQTPQFTGFWGHRTQNHSVFWPFFPKNGHLARLFASGFAFYDGFAAPRGRKHRILQGFLPQKAPPKGRSSVPMSPRAGVILLKATP